MKVSELKEILEGMPAHADVRLGGYISAKKGVVVIDGGDPPNDIVKPSTSDFIDEGEYEAAMAEYSDVANGLLSPVIYVAS